MNTKQSSTGGTITYHPWGLVHTAGKQYGGIEAEREPKSPMTKQQIPEAEDNDD
jgi:hypothetical protein